MGKATILFVVSGVMFLQSALLPNAAQAQNELMRMRRDNQSSRPVKKITKPLNLRYTPKQSDVDVLLGGLNFRGQPISESEWEYGVPYVEPIYASDLFEMLSIPSLEEFAKRRAQLPVPLPGPTPTPAPENGTSVAPVAEVQIEDKPVVVTDEIRKEYTSAVSKKLDQLFVFKTVAGILDTEADLMKLSLAAPEERVSYAVRKILLIDGARLAQAERKEGERRLTPAEYLASLRASAEELALYRDEVFRGYIGALISRYKRDGAAGFEVLRKMGIDAAVRAGDVKAFARFKRVFDAAMRPYVASEGKLRRTGIELPHYDEIPYEIIAYYTNTLAVDEEWLMFRRLKTMVAEQPFQFTVRWRPGNADAVLIRYADRFEGEFMPLQIAGQMPMVPVPFPESLQELRRLVSARVGAIQRYLVRQKVANTIMLSHWRNRDLLNPFKVHNPKNMVEMFNPLGRARMFVTNQELEQTYESVKDQIAGHMKQEFTVTEIKLGRMKEEQAPNQPGEQDDSNADLPVTPPSVAPELRQCVGVFSKAFEGPYVERQKALLAELKAKRKDMTQEEFEAAVLKARLELPATSYENALKELRAYKDENGRLACRNFPIELVVHRAKYDSRPSELLSADAQGRVEFFKEYKNNPQMQDMMIPDLRKVDSRGNVHYYFFQQEYSPEFRYIPMEEDRQIHMTVRDIIMGRRLADALAEAFGTLVGKRYVIHARHEAFSYEGVDGYQLQREVMRVDRDGKEVAVDVNPPRAVVSNPRLWIPQLFQNHSSEMFEKAYHMP